MRKREQQGRRMKSVGVIFLIFSLLALLTALVIAPPTPHNVAGRVLTDSLNGVPNGVPVIINNTVSGVLAFTEVFAPAIPSLKGSYSATIDGEDGDFIIGTAWNESHYGMANTSLLSTTTPLNIHLNRSRDPEANITILSPGNNSIQVTNESFTLTANISILGGDGTNCNATISFSTDALNKTLDQNFTNQLGSINRGDHQTTVWNLTGLKEGVSNITVSALCLESELNFENLDSQFINVSIEDNSPPAITLISPENNTFARNNVTFFYNVSEGTGLSNCSLYYDGILNQTVDNPPPLTLLNFTVNNSAEGNHEWLVSCVDNSTNLSVGNSSTYTVTIDDTAPNVTLLSPVNNTPFQSSLNFSYNVTDNFNVTNCSLVLNNEVFATNHSILVNQSNSFLVSPAPANYNWTVNCSDHANNIRVTPFRAILAADLQVNSSSIAFSTSTFIEGDTITINATILNFGFVSITNATVQFFEGDPDSGGTQISQDRNVTVGVGSSTTTAVNYTVKFGLTTIVVIVDPPLATNGTLPEINELNNKANATIEVPPFHTFHGEIASDVFLDTSSDLSIIRWLNSTNVKGNIYVADTDSTVTFTTLQAFGRNVSNNVTIEDFAELDLFLNMTNLTQSLNRTYTRDGQVIKEDNFSVENISVDNIPIVNSTNTSNFVTGILWDYSDENNGTFNGTQDVVFITRMNLEKLGQYGTYDYEVNVPANLRAYIQPNLQNSVSFYREVT